MASRDSLSSPTRRMRVFLEVGVTIDLEMTVRAYRLRTPRTEFAVSEQARLQGDTHFKIWPTARRLGYFLWAELFRRI